MVIEITGTMVIVSYFVLLVILMWVLYYKNRKYNSLYKEEIKDMTRKSNKKIAEMRDRGKEIIDNLGNELVKDEVEISKLNDEIVDNDEISKLQRDEIIDDKIEINKLKDKVVEEENIIEENIQEMKEMKTKVMENKMKKDVKENKQNIKVVERGTVERKERKDFSAIENKLNRLVEIKYLPVNDEGLDIVYLVKVAGIDIRMYTGIIEANRLYIFMKKIVRDVIIDESAKVEVISLEVKTDDNDKIYYLLRIANKNVKIYTSIEEATRVAGYMTNVVNEILKIIN